MDSGIQMFTTDSVSTISSGKIVAQTSTFEQTSMTDDDPGIRIIGDNKVELVYKNRITNEEASIDLYNSDNSSNNSKLYIDNPRGTTSLIIDRNRRLGVGNIVPEAILHIHNHNNSNSEHIRVTNNDNLGMNMILTSSNTDIKANFGIRWYNSGSTTLVNNALVIRNLNGTNTVGIGTSTPSYTLDVSGNINFTGTLTQNGSTFTSPYTLPIASSSTLGGVKIGNNLSINGSGVLSATDTNTTYSVGDGGLTQNNFTDVLKTKLDGIATSANNYSLPAATSSSLGGIKVGTGLSIDSGTGVLSTNITSVGTLSSLTVSGDATFDTSTLKVDSSNNHVGIGTSSPSYALEINGTTSIGSSGGGEGFLLNLGVTGTVKGGTAGANYRAGYLYGDGNKNIILLNQEDGMIRIGSGNSSNGITVDTNNNVGIGTTSPESMLHLKSSGDVILRLEADSDNSGESDNPMIFMSQDGPVSGNNQYFKIGMNGDAGTAFTGALMNGAYLSSNDYLQFAVQGQAVMTMKYQNKYVGIGTTSPGEKLDVTGVTITEGLQVISSDVNNNNLTRPAIATRSSTSGIKDYEISAIPNYYTTRSSNYTADNGFLRIRAGGGTNANQTSYIDLTGYSISGYEDMLRNIVLGTSGTERMRIDKDGHVGIGTTSPNCALEVHGGSGSNDEVLILSNKKDSSASEYHSIFTLGGHHYDVYYNSTIQDGKSTSNGSNFHINYYSGGNVSLCGNGNGNVGIGTTSPGAKLEIYDNTTGSSSTLILRRDVSTYGSSDDGVAIEFKTRYTGNSADYKQSRIRGIDDNLGGQGSGSGGIAFDTYYVPDNNNVYTERMRISGTGNVGIGTTNPLSGLQVMNDNGLTVSGTATTGTRTAVLRLGSPYTTNHDAYCAKITSTNNHSSNYNSDLRFFTSIGDNQNATERMCILSTGYVGIGTSSPQVQLDVVGSAVFKSVDVTNTGGILLMPDDQGSSTNGNSSGRIFFNETQNNMNNYGFSLGFNGGDDDDILNWKANTFNINRHDNSVDGSTVLTILKNNGNIGIGTTSPTEKLEIGENSSTHDNTDKIICVSQQQQYKYNFGITKWNKYSSGSGKYDLEIGYKNIDATNNQNYGNIILTPYRNVGIGTTSPSQKLDIEGNGGSGTGRIRFTDTDTADNARNWFIGPYRSSDAAFQIVPSSTKGGTSPDISKTFQVSYNGYVGIGTTSPDYPLDVNGGVFSSTGISGTKFYARAAAHASSHTGNYTNTNISIRCNNGVWASTLFATSDSRIKENIEDVPDKLALEQVRNIPCRYYEYRDKLSRGSAKTIGFIAQEVESVLPIAVSIETSIIPNVYTNILDVTWEELTEINTETGIETKKYKMRTSTLTNINGVKYKFYVSNTENDEVEKIVTGNDDSTFTFEQQWTNVFCYGYEVEDFHVLDKNKLFALNFSATQELDRIQQQELTKVKDLEIENFLLKERVKDLESKMNDVLNRLAQLENN